MLHNMCAPRVIPDLYFEDIYPDPTKRSRILCLSQPCWLWEGSRQVHEVHFNPKVYFRFVLYACPNRLMLSRPEDLSFSDVECLRQADFTQQTSHALYLNQREDLHTAYDKTLEGCSDAFYSRYHAVYNYMLRRLVAPEAIFQHIFKRG